jgi:hypothetical protein
MQPSVSKISNSEMNTKCKGAPENYKPAQKHNETTNHNYKPQTIKYLRTELCTNYFDACYFVFLPNRYIISQ